VIHPDRLCLLTIFLLLSLARAQEASIPAKPAQKHDAAVSASEPQGSAQYPSGSDEGEGLIHLDVVVTDQTGKPVSGLKAADFTVLDGGQPEKIVSFHAYGEAGASPDPPVAITLVLDTLGLPPDLASRERLSVEAFLRQNGGRLAQPISILMLTETGLWRVGLPSTDGNALAESVAKNRVTISNGNPNHLSAQIDQGWQSQAPQAGTINPYHATDLPGEAALKALGAIATAERRQPGRKLLIWVGPGWGVGSGNPEEHAKTQPDKQALFDRIVWFSTLLRLARVSLYTFSVGEVSPLNDAKGRDLMLDPKALDPKEMGFPWYAVHPVTSPQQLPGFPYEALNLNRKVLAIESGGRVIDSRGDPLHQIDDCAREPSAFYTLTFNPSPADHADEYHDLKVDVRQPGLTAHSDTFYYDQPYFLDAPNPAIRKVTVAQLNQLLGAVRGESDGDIARQLSDLELTEGASDPQVASWTIELQGKKAREALVALVDASAFLDPPPAYVLTDAPPDENAQRQMVSLATEYLNKTIPRLPNFFAHRTAVHYEETPQFYVGNGRFTAAEPLHVVDTSKTTVLYRIGAEVEVKSPQRGKQDRYLTTYGTFGPAGRGEGRAGQRCELEPLGEGRERRTARGVSVCGPSSSITVSDWRMLSSGWRRKHGFRKVYRVSWGDRDRPGERSGASYRSAGGPRRIHTAEPLSRYGDLRPGGDWRENLYLPYPQRQPLEGAVAEHPAGMGY
jgi:VWFA-related protein